MTINGMNGVNSQIGQMGRNQAADSYSRSMQNQIAGAQKQLQEISSNENLSLEEKMKKREEIQKKINDLNTQLRQHQMEQRREKQQSSETSMDDMLGSKKNSGSAKSANKGTGISQAGMTALISADSSKKQAKVQGSAATNLNGTARVLKSEIEMDKKRGIDTQKQEEDLAELEQNALKATASQMRTLNEVSKTLEEAAKEDAETEKTERKEGKPDGRTEKTEAREAMPDGKVEKTDNEDLRTAGTSNNVTAGNVSTQTAGNALSAAVTSASVSSAAAYTSVDIRL